LTGRPTAALPRAVARLSPSTVHGRLLLTVFAVLIPALLLAGMLLWQTETAARQAQQRQLTETARALSLVADRQVGEHAALLRALSTSRLLRGEDWAGFDRQAREAVAGPNSWVVVNEIDGQQRINTRAPLGATLPSTPTGAFGPNWAGAREPGVRISNMLYGPVARQPVVAVLRRVPLASGREVELSIVTLAADFERIFRDQRLPDRWTGAILDDRGVLMARSRDSDKLRGRRASADMLQAMEHQPAGVVTTETLDGVKTHSAFSRLPGYGWTAIVGVPRQEMSIAAAQVLWGSALALFILGAGAALAAAAARRIERPVTAWADAARRWTETGVLETPRVAGLRETDALATAFTDAVARLQAREAALAESETRKALALAASGAGLWDWNLEDNVVEWSPELFRLVGAEPRPPGPELLDLWMSLLLPDSQEAAARAVERALTGEPIDMDLQIRRADTGEARWLRSHGMPLRDADGVVKRVVGVNLDITDLRRSQEVLAQANKELASTVDARTRELDHIWKLSRDPFLIADSEGRWLRASPAWTDILGWSEAELVGKTSEWMEHPEDRARTRAADAQLASGETITRFENRFRSKDGHYRWFSWTAVPFEGQNFCVARDVTAEREAMAELARAQEALRQAQKMDAMGQLTGGVAHDFNNLLTPILGSLDMLQRRQAELDERSRRLIDGALQSAERARVLVQRLLAFARRQPLQPAPVDVARLIEGMGELIASTAGPRIRIVVEAPEALPPARGDVNQLEMALLNLAVNARDAMPDGGTLTIAAQARSVAEDEIPGLRAGAYVCLSVTDTGSGMDRETLARAVEPFFSTKGVGRGTGLGLSMVHGLAGQLGGALKINSTPGVGTQVELWLPKARARTAAAEAQHEGDALAAQAAVALLVDDEDLVRTSAGDMLAELGYAVVEARSATEALSLVEAGLAPTLLVTDHLMPGMTGAELAAEIRHRLPDVLVLVISGYAEAEGLAASLPRLAKPFRQHELAAALADLTPTSGRTGVSEPS
jgi:PAS domain S-box-containing protein